MTQRTLQAAGNDDVAAVAPRFRRQQWWWTQANLKIDSDGYVSSVRPGIELGL